ncbi:MAG: hypothetical protein MJ252_02315 [archaeon]|nr:hypothetical protein [archaeon]
MSDEIDEPTVDELLELYPKLNEYVKKLKEDIKELKEYAKELEEMAQLEDQIKNEEPVNNNNTDSNKEIQKLRENNREKNKEIEKLMDDIEKIKKELQQAKEFSSNAQKKISTLESDIYESKDKLRQRDAEIEDKDSRLILIEEQIINLTQQFEDYKVESENQLLRKEQELRDAKNDITIKEKTIERLNKRQLITQNIMNSTNPIKGKELKKRMSLQVNIGKSFNPIPLILGMDKNSEQNKDNKLPVKRNSLGGNNSNTLEIKQKTNEKKSPLPSPRDKKNLNEVKETPEKFQKGFNQNKNSDSKNSKLKPKTINEKIPEQDEENENEKEEEEKKEIKETESNKDNSEESNNTVSNESEANIFDNLEIEQATIIEIISSGKRPFLSSIAGNINSLKNDKKITENLKDMLLKIQQRKKYLINHKKNINEKLEKLGVKIR